MHEYTLNILCLYCFLLLRRNTLGFNQSSTKPSLPIKLSTLLPSLLRFCRTTFLETAVCTIRKKTADWSVSNAVMFTRSGV